MTLGSRVLVVACFATGLACATPVAAAAEAVYRWVDASGTVHFTQTAPRGVPFERVSPSGPGARQAPSFYNPRRGTPATAQSSDTPAAAPGAPAQGLTPGQQERQAELQAEADARLNEMAAAKQRNCELARQQFEEFTTFARIRVADGEGGVRILTEAERAERIAEAEEAILLNCEGAG